MINIDLRIETATEALRLLQDGWPTRAISLVGDDLRFDLPWFGPHHFIARFHDVEAPTDGYVSPEKHVVKATLDHAAHLRADDRLLVHCHAGKSRSPALAIGILIAAGGTPGEALEKVKQLRPFVIPNRLMIRQLDDILDQKGELVTVVASHYSTLPPEASLPDRGRWNA
jgi:predicted protein tyrosine phosphatase